jgi:hypothetical protein
MKTSKPRKFFAANPSIVSEEWLEWEVGDCATRDRICKTKDEKLAREIVAAMEFYYAGDPPKPTGSSTGFLSLLSGVVEAERLVVVGLSPEMPCRKMHENRHRAFREALSMATAYFNQPPHAVAKPAR